jgi:hypothetical protein
MNLLQNNPSYEGKAGAVVDQSYSMNSAMLAGAGNPEGDIHVSYKEGIKTQTE